MHPIHPNSSRTSNSSIFTVRIIIVPVGKDPKLELTAMATVNLWFWGSCACSRGLWMWNMKRRNGKDTEEPRVLRGECPNNFLLRVFPSLSSLLPFFFLTSLSLLSPLSSTGQQLATQMVKVSVCDGVSWNGKGWKWMEVFRGTMTLIT